MKNFNYILFLNLIWFSVQLQAQQDPTYTMYNYNMNVINPAYVGSEEGVILNSNFRSQWITLDEAPETQSFSLASSVGKNVGLGLSLVNDKVSVLRETDVYVDFSYKVKVSENNDLYFGLKAGGSFININLQSLDIDDDPLFNENVNRFNPNIGAGLYLKGKKYFINVAAPTLLSSKRYEKEGNLVIQASNRMHIYAGGGYTFDLKKNDYGRSDFSFTPSFMTRFVAGIPFSMDVSASFGIFEKLDLAVSHRLKESVSGVMLFKLADWGKLGYAYDHTLTDVGKFSSGSHEVILRFHL